MEAKTVTAIAEALDRLGYGMTDIKEEREINGVISENGTHRTGAIILRVFPRPKG